MRGCCRRKSNAANSLLADGEESQNGLFGFWIAVSFTVNYVMGSGFLSIPHGFVASGLILGIIMVLFFTVVCNITKDMLLDCMARAELYTAELEKVEGPLTAVTAAARRSSTYGATDSQQLLQEESAAGGSSKPEGAATAEDHQKTVIPPAASIEVKSRRFEISDLIELFLSPTAKKVYVAVLSLYMYGAMWAYSSVFAASMADNIPLNFLSVEGTCDIQKDWEGCGSHYLFFLAIFALICIPLSVGDLKEQLCVQVTMTFARILVVVLMVVTVLMSETCEGKAFDDDDLQEWSFHDLFTPAGTPILMPIAIYASIFHHSIAVVSQSVRHKRRLPRVFATAFTFTSTGYCILAVIVALYFGHATGAQANLLWGGYIGCSTYSDTPWWARMLAISVLVFPAADVISAFPLHAVTLGNNLITLTTLEDVESSRNPAPGTPTSPNEAEAMDNGMSNDPAEGQSTEGATPTTIAIRLSTAQGSGGSEEAPYFSTGFETAADAPTSTPRHRHSCCDRNKSCGANFRACLSAAVRTPRRRKVLFRLLAAIPPIVGAAFVSSLDEILHFTGLVGVFIAFIIPPWLWRASQRGCIELYARLWGGQPPSYLESQEAATVHGTFAPSSAATMPEEAAEEQPQFGASKPWKRRCRCCRCWNRMFPGLFRHHTTSWLDATRGRYDAVDNGAIYTCYSNAFTKQYWSEGIFLLGVFALLYLVVDQIVKLAS